MEGEAGDIYVENSFSFLSACKFFAEAFSVYLEPLLYLSQLHKKQVSTEY